MCLEAGYFGEAKHEVHILDSLSPGSFNQIVDAANNNKLTSPGINVGVDKTKVAP